MNTWIEQNLLTESQLFWALNTAVAVLVASALGLAAAWLLRRRPAPLRYGLLLAATLLAVGAPGGMWLAQQARLGWLQVPIAPPPAMVIVRANPTTPHPVTPSAKSAISAEPMITPSPTETWRHVAWWQWLGSAAVAVWGIGAAVALARLARGLILVARLRANFMAADDPDLLDAVENAARLLGMRRVPAVFTSQVVLVPMVIGLLRPALVAPHGLAQRLSPEQLLAVVLHETAHIAHGDLWIGLLQRLAAVMFWWCPLVYAVSGRLSGLREEICDNYVLQNQGNGLRLAQALVELAAAVQRAALPRLVGAMGILDPARGGLEGRVARLLRKECDTMTRMNWTATLAAALFGLMVCAVMIVVNVQASAANEEKADISKLESAKLIDLLSDPDGKVRVAATKEVFARGKDAVDPLQKARDTFYTETRQNAGAAAAVQPLKKVPLKGVVPQPPGAPVNGVVPQPQKAPVNIHRISIVYLLLNDLKTAGNYNQTGFVLFLEKGSTEHDVAKMGEVYGFSGALPAKGLPHCWVELKPGKKLQDVLRAVLSEEPKVVAATLQHRER